MCENMNWNHLPVAGGLYDQSVEFIDQVEIMFQQKNKQARLDHEARERDSKAAAKKKA